MYVRPFHREGGTTPVSVGGGRQPRWSEDGRELFYENGDALMVAAVTFSGATLRVGAPRLLFRGRYYRNFFSVTRDAKRFLRVQETGLDERASQIHVVVNWTEELKRLVPTRQEEVADDVDELFQ